MGVYPIQRAQHNSIDELFRRLFQLMAGEEIGPAWFHEMMQAWADHLYRCPPARTEDASGEGVLHKLKGIRSPRILGVLESIEGFITRVHQFR